MIKRFVLLFFAMIGGVLGWVFLPQLLYAMVHHPYTFLVPWISFLLGAVILPVVMAPLVRYLTVLLQWLEIKLRNAALTTIVGATIGIVIGLTIAYLLGPSIRAIPFIGVPVQFFAGIVLAYFGFRIGTTRKLDIIALLIARRQKSGKEIDETSISVSISDEKFLDTSAIIDGRIAELAKTRLLDGVLVVPSFVLDELQVLVNLSDDLKSVRGRRGLDVVKQLQSAPFVTVQILEVDFPDIHEVDAKLVHLAKERKGKVVTNDFNLNKVCELHQVPVLNVNDLANAIRPVLLAGEQLTVRIIKRGKEYEQGVGYLDDGTMVVVDHGRTHIDQQVFVVVTSVINTSAGRIVFANIADIEKSV